MKYYSQLEIEKLVEYLYDVQCEEVGSNIESNKAIRVTRRAMIRMQDINRDYLDKRIGQYIRTV